MPTSPWIRHENPSGFTLEHPPGWEIQTEIDPIVLVMSPDRTQLALVEPLGMVLGSGTPAEILRHGRFTATSFFHAAVPGPIEEDANSASCLVNFSFADGRRGFARVTCKTLEWGRTIFAVAALLEAFPQAEPTLRRILNSFEVVKFSPYEKACQQGTGRRGYEPSWKLAPASAPAPPALSFVPFTDPMAGGFVVDVPRGWQVRGGLHHPGLGDRRWFVEAQSADGITVMLGDPNCPHDFCHYPMTIEDVMIPTAVGCTFLNIPPQAKRLASYYFKNVAPQRFGPLKISGERDRKDMAAECINGIPQRGFPVSSSFKLSVHEVRFEAGGRIGCCFALSWHDAATSLGFMTVWEGTLYTWLAPPALAAVADEVLTRMRNTYRPTPQMAQVVQQDEMLIASNGMAVNMNQQMWFQGQQAAHRAQLAQGDAIVNNYWQQQRVNEGITQSYWNAQHTYDRLSQDRSDAMLDRQRLFDDGMGKSYDASAGYNYYWLDQQSGQVVGTNTSEPPDYQRNYTALRKL